MCDPRRMARDFVKQLTDIDRSKHADEIFRDFCEMSFCALAKLATLDPERLEKLERQFMEVVRRYPGLDLGRNPMGELLGRATIALRNGGCDFFGLVAGEIGMLDARMGQFFTPYEVSRLNAEIILGDIDGLIAEKGFVSVHEPAAGAGGMLVAVADVFEGRGHDLSRTLWAEAVELSRSTFHMAYVQMSLRGIPGRVIHGNSLSLEVFTGAMTPAGARFPHLPPHLVEPVREKAAIEAEPLEDRTAETMEALLGSS